MFHIEGDVGSVFYSFLPNLRLYTGVDQMAGNTFRSLKHIKANNPDQLESKMLQLQIALGMELQFQDIRKDGIWWYAWYRIDRTKEVEEKIAKGVKKK